MIDVTKKLNVDKVEIIAAGVDHAEGITITPDMTIYCGGEAGQIYRIDKRRNATFFVQSVEVNRTENIR